MNNIILALRSTYICIYIIHTNTYTRARMCAAEKQCINNVDMIMVCDSRRHNEFTQLNYCTYSNPEGMEKNIYLRQ